MSKIKAIFFDLDNTLIDFKYWNEASCKSAVDAMVKAGLGMDEGAAYQKLMRIYLEVGMESNRAFTKFLNVHWKMDHKILAAGINAYLEEKAKRLKPYPNVEKTLQELDKMGIFLAIVTDAPNTKAYQRLLSMSIEKYFKFLVGFDSTGQPKSNSIPIKFAFDKLKKEIPDIDKSQILAIGDSFTSDIKPAKDLGFVTAHAKYGHVWEEDVDATPDYSLNDVIDVLEIV